MTKSIEELNLPVASRFRCKIVSWFMIPDVFQEAKKLYGDREGQHATPSEIALTLFLEPGLVEKQRKLNEPSPAGPIYDYRDFRRRYPDGRMGSDPFLAKSIHGQVLLEKASQALKQELSIFLED